MSKSRRGLSHLQGRRMNVRLYHVHNRVPHVMGRSSHHSRGPVLGLGLDDHLLAVGYMEGSRHLYGSISHLSHPLCDLLGLYQCLLACALGQCLHPLGLGGALVALGQERHESGLLASILPLSLAPAQPLSGLQSRPTSQCLFCYLAGQTCSELDQALSH